MKKGTFAFWSVFSAAAVFRIAYSLHINVPDASTCLKHPNIGIGMITEDPSRAEAGQVIVVNVEKIFDVSTSTDDQKLCAADISIQLKTKLYPRFSYGDRITFTGRLSKPFDFSGDNGRQFDYQGYLAIDDVYYEMRSATVLLATTSADRSIVGRITSALLYLKRGFVANLERVLGEPHAALAAGLVVGEKSALGSDLLNDFRTVGLIHIVVLSGFNITIVGIAMRRMLSFLPRVWGIIIGAIGILSFGILVGGGATVVRSCFMAGIALIADLIRRDYNVARALAFAALIMLIQNPLILLHDTSFQLSFLATIGLILLASPIEDRLQFIPDIFGMRGTIASCLATQIFVSPFILYIMGQISLIGVVVNILVLPFIPATMLFVFMTGAAGFVSHPVSIFIGWGTHLLLSYELFMVQNFARLPFAALQIPPFSGWYAAAFYLIFITAYILVKKFKPSSSSDSPR